MYVLLVLFRILSSVVGHYIVCDAICASGLALKCMRAVMLLDSLESRLVCACKGVECTLPTRSTYGKNVAQCTRHFSESRSHICLSAMVWFPSPSPLPILRCQWRIMTQSRGPMSAPASGASLTSRILASLCGLEWTDISGASIHEYKIVRPLSSEARACLLPQ